MAGLLVETQSSSAPKRIVQVLGPEHLSQVLFLRWLFPKMHLIHVRSENVLDLLFGHFEAGVSCKTAFSGSAADHLLLCDRSVLVFARFLDCRIESKHAPWGLRSSCRHCRKLGL